MKRSRFVWILILTGLVSSVVWLGGPLPAAALPPRPEPQPTATPLPKPVGGAIELRVAPAGRALWTVVQWQDSLGGWHDVEGWQGKLDGSDDKTWWVHRADFGKGPFRWAMYQGVGGEWVATSEGFYLPRFAGDVVRVQVSLSP